MKRLLSLILVVTLMTVMAVPCFAAEAEPRSTSTVQDQYGNTYTITYDSIINNGTASVYTVFRRTNLVSSDYEEIEHSVGVTGYVVLNSWDPNNINDTLTGAATGAGKTTNTAQATKMYSYVIQSISSDHTFAVDGVRKASYVSGAYNTDW